MISLVSQTNLHHGSDIWRWSEGGEWSSAGRFSIITNECNYCRIDQSDCTTRNAGSEFPCQLTLSMKWLLPMSACNFGLPGQSTTKLTATLDVWSL